MSAKLIFPIMVVIWNILKKSTVANEYDDDGDVMPERQNSRTGRGGHGLTKAC
jgi:hypothetical protein